MKTETKEWKSLRALANALESSGYMHSHQVRRLESDVSAALTELASLRTEVERLKGALGTMSADMHEASTRPCPTCDPITVMLGKPFGCSVLRQRRAALSPEPKEGSKP